MPKKRTKNKSEPKKKVLLGNPKFFLICGMNYERFEIRGQIFQIVTLPNGTTLELNEMIPKLILTHSIKWNVGGK
jgi:hypothetical protein